MPEAATTDTPLLLALLDRAPYPMSMRALEALADLYPGHPAVPEVLRRGLGSQDAGVLADCARLAARWGAAPLAEPLWELLAHSCEWVRHAAARALGGLGDQACQRAGGLLGHARSTVREAAGQVLARVASRQALDLLEAHLDREPDAKVRDTLLPALHPRRCRPTREELAARVARLRSRRPSAPWLDRARLPGLADQDGQAWPPSWVRYLLYRQSRAPSFAPDLEAEPLYARVDRVSGAVFAQALLGQYLTGGGKEAWPVEVAGHLGDDACVPLLCQLVDKRQDKHALEALAWLGTGAAWLATDELVLRHPTLRCPAGCALDRAAERLGVTPQEVRDGTVPTPALPLEAVGLDFQAGNPEVQGELDRVVGEQLLRLETMLGNQSRWQADLWRERFLRHPILRPFGVRLVWGRYDRTGELQGTFRATPEGALIDLEGRSSLLGPDTQVGLVHPAELLAAALIGWRRHLAQAGLEPPFAQLERALLTPAPDQLEARSLDQLRGVCQKIQFWYRQRASQLGWIRRPLWGDGPGGPVFGYLRRFRRSSTEAWLEVEGRCQGTFSEPGVRLGRIYFLPLGTLQEGTDLPETPLDPRLLALQQVPRLVYSEVVGSLARLAAGGPDPPPGHGADWPPKG